MQARLRNGTLGVCALALGLLAIAGSGVATAEPTARWDFTRPDGTTGSFTNTLEALPVLAFENNTATLKIHNLTLKILCTGAEFDEKGEMASEGTLLLGRLKFTGCVSLINGVISNPCRPTDPTSGAGTILTEKGKGLIKLHALAGGTVDTTVLLVAHTLTLTKIFLGEECAAGEELLVGGELVLHDVAGNAAFQTKSVTHLLVEFPGLQLMHVGVNKALFEGSVNVTLGGPHTGYKWAAIPG